MITPVVFRFQCGKYPSRPSGTVAVDIFPPSFKQRAQPDDQLDNEQLYERRL
jgi:hypothetical protein